MKKLVLIFLVLTGIHLLSSQTLIPNGASWKYLDDGSDKGTAWRDLSFDDSGWKEGAAQLGYGDGDETTVISYGNSSSNKHVCYYFRKIINIDNPSANKYLKISLLRDDGAVVYINGKEVVRSNMPSGTINFNTFASHTVGGTDENTFYKYEISSSVLKKRENIIAVEVHQRSHTSSDVSFDLKLEFGILDYFKKDPYVLYTGNNDEMLVIWQMTEKQNCELTYGKDSTFSAGKINTSEYGNDHQHKVILRGLDIDEKYFYKVSVNDTIFKCGSFNTGLPDTAKNVTFFAYGDTRSIPGYHNIVAVRIMSDIEKNNLAQTFIINSGDLVSDGNSESSWNDEFFNTSYPIIIYLLANLPYLSAIGNHEGQGVLFKKYFPYPMFMNNRFYYSFDYGPVHITVIDQETSYYKGSTQYNWIVNDLSSSNKIWKIAVFHKPGWSAGGHSNNSYVQDILQPLFEKYNVSMVINGHNHYYSRAVVNGINHITTGGGGAPLYPPNASYPNIVKIDKSNHYCKLEINGDTLHFSAIRSNGHLIEDFEVIQNHTAVNDYSKSDNNWYVYTGANNIIIKTEIPSGKIEVYDNWGRKIITKNVNTNKTEVNPYQTGIYYIRYILNDKMSIKKVVYIK